MLSVNCMLNHQQEDYFSTPKQYPSPTPSASSSTTSSASGHRSKLDIANLLCQDHSDTLPTPCLSPSPPNMKISLPSFDFSSIMDRPSPNNNNNNNNYNNNNNNNMYGSSMPTTPSTSSPSSPHQHFDLTDSILSTAYDGYGDDDTATDCTMIPYTRGQYQGHYYQNRKIFDASSSCRQYPQETATSSFVFSEDEDDDFYGYELMNINGYNNNNSMIKAKRRRASNKQLQVLNRVFERTFFPSTQLRTQLGRQLGMSPRTVQIWFQNRRQAIRTKERQQQQQQKSHIHYQQQQQQQQQQTQLQHHHHHHQQQQHYQHHQHSLHQQGRQPHYYQHRII